MQNRYSLCAPSTSRGWTPSELRERFLVEDLFSRPAR
jgi:hypothetical protein